MVEFILRNIDSIIVNGIVALIFLIIGIILPKAIRVKGNYSQIWSAVEGKIYSLKRDEYKSYLNMLKMNNKCLIDLRTELIYKGMTIILGTCSIILIMVTKLYLETIHNIYIVDDWAWLIYVIFLLNFVFIFFRIIKYIQLRGIIKHLIKCPEDLKDFDKAVSAV